MQKKDRHNFVGRTYSASLSRVLALFVMTLALAGMVATMAWHSIRDIPPGDGVFRIVAFGWCGLLNLSLLVVAYQLFDASFRRTIHMEAGRLVIRDSNALVASHWGEVTMGQPRRRFGVRYVEILVAGRPRRLDDLFFPQFDEICAQVAERIQLHDATARYLAATD